MLDITEFDALEEGEVVYLNDIPAIPELIYSQILVDPMTECWIWNGLYVGNHPRVVIEDPWGQTVVWMTPLRYSYMVHFNKTLHHGESIWNVCNNPYCCNPDHLVLTLNQEYYNPHENVNFFKHMAKDDVGTIYSSAKLMHYMKTGELTKRKLRRDEILKLWSDNYYVKGGRFYTSDGRRIKSFMATPTGYAGTVGGVSIFWTPRGEPRSYLDANDKFALSIYAYRPNDNDKDFNGPMVVNVGKA